MNWLGTVIKPLVDDGDSVLDLGCGLVQPTDLLGPRHLCVDVFPPALERLRDELGAMVLWAEIPQILDRFVNRSWDVVMLLDVLEHLEKRDAWISLRESMRVARKRVIVFTPKGYVVQSALEDRGLPLNSRQEHLCGFEVEELQQLGFECSLHPNRTEQAGQITSIFGVWEVPA